MVQGGNDQRHGRPTGRLSKARMTPSFSVDLQRPGSPLSRAVAPPAGVYSVTEPAVTASTTSPALVISILRGLASSATGMVRVSTPFS